MFYLSLTNPGLNIHLKGSMSAQVASLGHGAEGAPRGRGTGKLVCFSQELTGGFQGSVIHAEPRKATLCPHLLVLRAQLQRGLQYGTSGSQAEMRRSLFSAEPQESRLGPSETIQAAASNISHKARNLGSLYLEESLLSPQDHKSWLPSAQTQAKAQHSLLKHT